MKIMTAVIALLFSALLFGCLGNNQQGQAAAAAPNIATKALPPAVATVDASQASNGVDDALNAMSDASNSTSGLDVGDMNSSDLNYVG